MQAASFPRAGQVAAGATRSRAPRKKPGFREFRSCPIGFLRRKKDFRVPPTHSSPPLSLVGCLTQGAQDRGADLGRHWGEGRFEDKLVELGCSMLRIKIECGD